MTKVNDEGMTKEQSPKAGLPFISPLRCPAQLYNWGGGGGGGGGGGWGGGGGGGGDLLIKK